MDRDIYKAVYIEAEKRYEVTQLAAVKIDPRVVPQKDSIVKCLYYGHPSFGDITAMIRKSKIKYGGY